MPKVKTNSGAKKRFALTGSGKIKRKHAFKSHILTKRPKAETQPYPQRSRIARGHRRSESPSRSEVKRVYLLSTPQH